MSDTKYPCLLAVTRNGFGKTTSLEEYRETSRGAKGVKTLNVTKKTGELVLVQVLNGSEEYLIMTSKSGITIRINLSDVNHTGRNTQGTILMRLDSGDEVISGSVN
jgi:DNA gyrase subunit A